MSMPALALVVLDCDGTLVDSQRAICTIMQECFTTHGLTAPEAAAVRGIVGLQLDEAILRLLGPVDTHDPLVMAETYRQVAYRLRDQDQFEEPLFPGTRDGIVSLADKGYLLGIATGKSSRGLRDTLVKHGLEGYFTTLQTSDVAPGKPNPEMLYRAMRETGADPQATIMVGDTTFDIEMARAAGTYAIGVGWGYHDRDALVGAGAHRIVETYTDLVKTIHEIFGEGDSR
jgi:phosphoglycolate phosphatase